MNIKVSSCRLTVDQTFAGSLLSSVTCSKCQTTSTTIDPILDVQLDFPTDASDMNALTLTDMLKRFCAAEKVGDASKGYDCSNCGGGSGVVSSCFGLASTPGADTRWQKGNWPSRNWPQSCLFSSRHVHPEPIRKPS